jgi:phosphoglycolate phosphatase
MSKSFEAVIFDLDGTLLDTLDDLADSMNAVLRIMGFETHETEAYRSFTGNGIVAMAERVLPPDHRDQGTVMECVQEMKKEYRKRWAYKTKPYPGIPELLDKLKKKNVRISVLSNKVHEFTELSVKRLLPDWEFDCVLGMKAGMLPKPDPHGALSIAKKMEIEPKKIVYLGDTDTDMKTAVAAGMLPVGGLWGFRTEKELKKSGACHTISKPEQLLRFI